MIFVLLAACDLVLGLDDYHPAALDGSAADAARPDATARDAAFDASRADAASDGGLDLTPSALPVLAANDATTCAIDTMPARRGVYCWGFAENGAIGDDRMSAFVDCPDGEIASCTLSPSLPVRRADDDLLGVLGVFGRGRQFCAIHDGTRRLACWGEFRGNISYVAADTLTTTGAALGPVVSFDASGEVVDAHACAVLSGGDVYCWGDNSYGQLGAPSGALESPNTSLPVDITLIAPELDEPGFVEVATPSFATCAREALPSGRVFCWGRGSDGGWPSVIGDGRAHPDSVTAPASPARLETAAVQIRAGARHVCALDVAGTVWCWGDPADLHLDGAVKGLMPMPIALPLRIRSIATGQDHTCAVAIDGSVFCWGSNVESESGASGTSPTSHVPLTRGAGVFAATAALGARHGCFRSMAGDDYCWGSNHAGQLGDPGISRQTATPTPVAWP